MMSGNAPTWGGGDQRTACVDRDPVFSFVESGVPDPDPRLLVDRLLYARVLLQANTVLAPRFLLGECAAAHHIVLGDAQAGVVATDRLRGYGFLVEPWTGPPGIRFVLSSTPLRALLTWQSFGAVDV